jgi:COP9 signalosome complex subunit 3
MDEAKLLFDNWAPATPSSTSKAYDAAAKTYAAAVTTKLPPAIRTAILRDPIQSLQVLPL